MDENPKQKFGFYAVCLVDALGQKELLKQWNSLDKTDPNVMKAIKESVYNILSLKNTFLTCLNALEDKKDLEKIADTAPNVPQNIHEALMNVRTHPVSVQHFSDTFVFYAPVTNPSGHVSATALLRMLLNCCIAMQISFATKLPLRGAMSIGAGVELEKNSFYGYSLADAHHLESKVADYPRILISPKIMQFLSSVITGYKDGVLAPGMRESAILCQSIITKDTDNQYILDFIGKGIKKLLKESPQPIPIKEIYKYACDSKDKFSMDGNKKLEIRYERLSNYIKSRLPIWGIDSEF